MIETDLKRKNAKETKVPKKIKHQKGKSPSKRKTPEKQQLQDSDSDFEKGKKRSHQSKKTKKKKTMVKEFYSMKNRCSPEALLSIILGMSKQQKESVRSMSFGALLKMKITDIPLKLGFYILQKFDSERMVIDIEGKELKITAESVHDMLGIPIGGTKLTQLDQWPKDDTKKIRYRETFEQEKGRFGLGELNEELVNEQDEGHTNLEESDSDKDEDHYVEAYESKISKMLNSFERMKEKLNSKLNDAITKFPEKESFRIFDENMTNIIGEEKTEGTTIFEIPSNQTGFEGINLTLIMDDEGNHEEVNDNDGSQSEVDYLLDSNEGENEGIKNDGDKNKKESETEVKGKYGKNNENDNDEEKKDDDAEETNNHEETSQQTENENLLDKVVDNIVDNVLGIQISSLNSQEDEVWNDHEMKTIFDNIDIEKEKLEGVHEQGTKVEKTKGDDTGKENSEDRNKRGTEAKNTKNGGEDKHRETEKKKLENENKKGEKADKTKRNNGDTHPSFSLGLSPDSDQTSSKKSNESSPKKPLTKKQIKDGHQKRCGCPDKIWSDNWMSSYGKSICKHRDCWRSFRHLTAYLNSTFSDERKYEKFKKNFHDSTNGYKKILNIKDIDMKPSIEILDNTAVEGDYEGKYGVILKPLKNLFVRYLKEINHPRANAISKESIKPQRLEMTWRTIKNKVDCGIFAMRHMETYMGQPLSKWKQGLHKESAIQPTTLEKLRQRYAHIMLTSKINMLKAKVLDLPENIKKLNSKCVLIMHTRLCKQFKKVS
uniref:Ubiquitin-like protease family profile domain-containing protein n=1 Tax=Lactuca sativa TaxID=4236 RepID=A0A9R1W0N5_LACSA|nr:hypothetical protein LSAT_V11C300129960 [Lactuca sativa]